MERYIHMGNIRRYRRLLEEEQDEEKRNIIRKLLAEEEAKDVPASPKDRSPKSKHIGERWAAFLMGRYDGHRTDRFAEVT